MYNLANVASWWTTSSEKNGTLFDNIFISYEDNNVVTFLPFRRAKSYSFCEVSENYIVVYNKNAKFLDLLFKLRDKREHTVSAAA